MDFSLISTAEKITVLNTLQSTYHALQQKHCFPAGCGSISMRVGPYDPLSYYFAINMNPKEHSQPVVGSISSASYPFQPNFIFINEKGLPCEATKVTSDKEASIHAKIYRLTGCNAILHIHKPLHYEISDHFHTQSYVSLDHNEVTRCADLDSSLDNTLNIPIFPALSQQEIANCITPTQIVANTLQPDIPILLGHQQGVYVWGDSLPQAIQRLEAFDFACELKRLSM
ncbi:methylthioribulose-1-phosphate dehydratase [Paenibacillus turicensis]|uniref:Methylthioribulose-1-phosphate dehydratase n=1 Tax=Paenibacillus turicensis TaxID=160487 RepID=A0ABS4FXF3_9BACL|nr:class II aldolase/adducin family protein [Paenibacillus turicensis]MBP1907253.1 methylthioribulose-1-phosphate dehydratase [Paenibacillus turicensis]